jgi:hypothetical protein
MHTTLMIAGRDPQCAPAAPSGDAVQCRWNHDALTGSREARTCRTGQVGENQPLCSLAEVALRSNFRNAFNESSRLFVEQSR